MSGPIVANGRVSYFIKTLFNNVPKRNFVGSRSRLFHSKMVVQTIPFSKNFFFRQLFDTESSTYTYILGDVDTKDAVVIDPVLEHATRDANIIKELGLKLKYCMNTHVHADHVTGTGALKKLLPGCKSVIARVAGANADRHVDPGELIHFGSIALSVRPTPGHTNGCVTYVCEKEGLAFTGDALLIRGCGRTDFQEGNPNTLYDSVHQQIFSLPDNFRLFPAHDYKGQTETSVWEEKLYNPRLTKSREEFINIMNNLGLAPPNKLDTMTPWSIGYNKQLVIAGRNMAVILLSSASLPVFQPDDKECYPSQVTPFQISLCQPTECVEFKTDKVAFQYSLYIFN